MPTKKRFTSLKTPMTPLGPDIYPKKGKNNDPVKSRVGVLPNVRRYNDNKTLKKRINQYICKKRDVCCERDIDRKLAIEDIFMLYSEIADFMYEKDEYLSYINNDLLIFIGYKMDLENKNDNEGIRLWNELDSKMFINKKLDKQTIMELLNNVPLYYLLSFLGYAYYKYKRNKPVDKAENTNAV